MHKIFFFMVCGFSLSIQSLPGDLDLTFGPDNTGIALTRIGRYNNLTELVIHENTHFYSVGEVEIKTLNSGIGKYTINGILDSSFNYIGYQRLLVGTRTTLSSIAMQSNGYPVVAGSAFTDQSNFVIARFQPTGEPDITFGTAGSTIERIGTGASIHALCIQNDQRIVVGGCAVIENVPQFTLARYNANGSLDTSFGNNGIAQTIIGKQSSIQALKLQDDGKIVVGGFAALESGEHFTLARYNSDGTLDATFGVQGIVYTPIGTISHIQAMSIQSDGKIVAAGYTSTLNFNDFALARYDTTGQPDLSFNSNGIVITKSDYDSMIFALAIQTDGKIVAGGYNFGAINTTFSLARYTAQGLLDSSFGTNGMVFTTIGSNAQIESLILQSDGKIIAGGYSDKNIAIARYLAE